MEEFQSTSQTSRKLPAGWRWARLGEVCEFVRGVSFDKADVRNKPGQDYLPILRAGNIQDSLEVAKDLVWVPRENVSPEQRLRYGDIAVCMSSGSPAVVGKTAILKHEWNGSVGAFCGIIRSRRIDSTEYIAYWLRSPDFIDWRDGQARGANIQNLRFSQFESIEIPLPPLPEQKRIMAILNEQMAAVEQARAAAESQLAMAVALPASFLRETFDGTEVREWPKKKIQDCCRLLPSKSIASDGDAEVNVATTACLTESGFQAGGVKKRRMWSGDVFECVLKSGEILIARSNTPDLVGRAAMYLGGGEEVVAADLTIRILAGKEVAPSFLAPYLSYLYLSGYWKERAGGASGSMKKITRSQILGEMIPLPSLSDQRRIAVSLSEKMMAANRIKKSIETQLESINKLPAVLLRQAFDGKY